MHFRGGEIAAGAAGETHDHGVVCILHAFQRNGEELFALQRHVLVAVGRRLTILVGIDAKHREVCVVARPHPVVLVEAELCDVLRRIGHQTHVGELLFVEEIILIGSEEGHDASHDAFLLFQVALLMELGCQGGEETLALCGVFVDTGLASSFVHLLRNIHDAQHESESEVGNGQLLRTVAGKVSVLQIIVLHRAHGVHKAETAMVVGEDESVGRNHLARATAAKLPDAFAQRG